MHVFALALTFAVGALLARQLGPEGYGVYALAMTITTLAGMVTEFGLPTLVLREIAAAKATGEWGRARGLLQWSNRFIVVVSAALAAGYLVAHVAWVEEAEPELLSALPWAMALVPLVSLAKIREHALLSLGHVTAGQFPILVLRPGVFSLSLAATWIIGTTLRPVHAMGLQALAATVCFVTVLVLYGVHRPAALNDARPVTESRKWLDACFPMGMTEGLRFLQGQVSTLLIGALGTTTAVGHYRVADSTSAMLALATTVITTAIAPLCSSLHASGRRGDLVRLMRAAALGTTTLTFLAGLPVVFAGPSLLRFLFGDGFGEAWSALIVLWLGQLTVAAMGPVSIYCNMTGRHRRNTVATGLGVATNIIVSSILVPHLAQVGAAIATTSGLILWKGAMLYVVHREDGINPTLLARADWRAIVVEGWRSLAPARQSSGDEKS